MLKEKSTYVETIMSKFILSTALATVVFALPAIATEVAGTDGSNTRAERFEPIAMQILQKIRGNWVQPKDAPDSFSCKVHVQQAPSGEVLSVEVDQDCGNDGLIKSIKSAVMKTSPLPKMPPDLFEKDLIMYFCPALDHC